MYSKLSQPLPERIRQVFRSYLPRIYSNKMLNILLEICRKYLEMLFCGLHYYNAIYSDTVFLGKRKFSA